MQVGRVLALLDVLLRLLTMTCQSGSWLGALLAATWGIGVLAALPLAVCIFLDPSRPDAPRWLVRATVVFIVLVALGTFAYGVLWFQAPAPSQWTTVK